ncbi:MAG: M48 family metallopeptidase [Caulobacterales bacterium]|nr:M48 family metallopeptidase [Caulobacterales bacterium]MCA0372178.1 M48 family metallopeptidase [Pseudomonadota bacterium]
MIKLDAPFEIVRTARRKTASITIENGFVKIAVPVGLSDDKIDEIVNKRREWIAKRIFENAKIKPQKSKQFISGESFAYLGKNYRLKRIVGKESGVVFKGGYLFVGVKPEWSEGQCEVHIRLELGKWFREQSMKRLKSKVKKYSEIIGVKPKSIKIQKLENRWGSCSPNGDIIFNWRIISAPNSVVDYVVVHELCHLKEHNHSEAFWNHVSRILPDYKNQKEWLKYNGDSLGLI